MSKINYKFLYNARRQLSYKLKHKVPYMMFERALKKYISSEYKTNFILKYERLLEQDKKEEEDEFSMGSNKAKKLLKLHNLIIPEKFREINLDYKNKNLQNFSYNLMYSDKEIIEELFKTLTTYAITLFPKIKAIVQFRSLKYREKEIKETHNSSTFESIDKSKIFEEILYLFANESFDNPDPESGNQDPESGNQGPGLTKYEIEFFDELESVGFILEHFIKNTMLEDGLIEYLNILKGNIPFFIDLINNIEIQLQYVKSAYKEIFINYCVYQSTPLMNIIHLSIYYEYLLLIEKYEDRSSCPDSQDRNTSFDSNWSSPKNENDICIESLCLNGGPLIVKALQKVASMTETDINKRNLISGCYGNLQKLIETEIIAIKEYLTSPRNLQKDNISDFEKIDFLNPLSVASIGQVNSLNINEEEYVLKFVKPRTILNVIAEIFLIKDIVRKKISKSEKDDKTLRVKKMDYLKYIIMHMLYEFNFEREKENIDMGKKYYEPMNILSVSLPEKEPIDLYNIPHLCMKKINGVSLSYLVKKRDKERITNVIPEMKHLIYVWIHNVLFSDGFFHADLHSGNIIVDNNDRLHLVDFGNSFILSEHEKKNLFCSIQVHRKLISLMERNYIFDNEYFYSIFKDPILFLKNPSKLFTLIRKVEDNDYIPYIKEICKYILNIVNVEIQEKDMKYLTEKVLEFIQTNRYKKCFGTLCECLLNNAKNIGSFSGSRVMEFTKGIYVLEKTWNLLLEISEVKENNKVINIAFNKIEEMNIFQKIKLYFLMK